MISQVSFWFVSCQFSSECSVILLPHASAVISSYCPVSEHTVVFPDRYKYNKKDNKISQRDLPIVGHSVRQQNLRQPMHFVRCAHENERRDQNIQIGKTGQQNEHTIAIGCQPNVILTDEQFQWDAPEPCEKRWESYAKYSGNIPEHDVADDWHKYHIRMDLFAVHFVATEEWEGRIAGDAAHRHQRGHNWNATRKQIVMCVVVD